VVNITVEYDDEKDTLTFFNDDFKVCTTTLEQFNKAYSTLSNDIHTEYMPVGVRGVFKSALSDNTWILYQQRPRYVRFNYTPKIQAELHPDHVSNSTFYLPMPWMLFAIVLNKTYNIVDIHGYVTRPNDTDLSQMKLYKIPLHNWHEENNLCRPIYQDLQEQSPDILSAVDRAYAEMWGSGFNNDLHDNIDRYIVRGTGVDEDGETFDGLIPQEHRQYLRDLYNKDRNLAYFRYYSLWASLSIHTVVNAKFEYVGKYQDIFWHLDPRDARSEEAMQNGPFGAVDLEFITTLLTTAQNSTMD
jgi:hypothetical protein